MGPHKATTVTHTLPTEYFQRRSTWRATIWTKIWTAVQPFLSIEGGVKSKNCCTAIQSVTLCINYFPITSHKICKEKTLFFSAFEPCPPSHPYVFADGLKCCSNAMRSSIGCPSYVGDAELDKLLFWDPDGCCQDSLEIDCPHTEDKKCVECKRKQIFHTVQLGSD